jgi:glycine/D-amino acid oxidase-like deaminating enzyme
MPRLRLGHPLWLDQPAGRKQFRFSQYQQQIHADVIIVGGGITGAIAAYVFADAGLSVALLEAKRIGRGSTAASTALLMQEPDKDFRELARVYGTKDSRRIWRIVGRATRDLIALIRRLSIPCDLRSADSIYYTIDPDGVADLRKEFEARRAAGLPGRWLSDVSTMRRTGIKAEAGILTRRNGQVDPYRACFGFVEHAVRKGARVFEHSPVRRIHVRSGGVEVKTPHGTLHASCVLVTTGYATPEFKPLAGRFRMMNTYVIATAPIRQSLRARLAAPDIMLWDTDRPYHYLRWTKDRRLLFGGADRRHKPARSRRKGLDDGRATLQLRLEALYPSLVGVELAKAWEGLFAETPDGLPYIGPHRRYPRHLFALGYGGNGMSVAFLAAQILLRRYQGASVSDDELFSFGRTRRAVRKPS